MEQMAMNMKCAPANKRPRVISDKMAMETALGIADDLIKYHQFDNAREDIASDIVAATRHNRHADGYEICRDLENQYVWFGCNMQIAKVLDTFSTLCSRVLDDAVKRWAAENPMEPPFPIGTLIDTGRHGKGFIKEISKYTPATYLVRIPDIKHGLFHVAFEDAIAA